MKQVIKYNKLVRDKIPEIIKKDGKKPIIYLASDKEYWKKLNQKLQEEVNEFLKENNEEELADVLEVLDAIIWYKKFSNKKIKEIKRKKQIERGGFKEKIILKEIR